MGEEKRGVTRPVEVVQAVSKVKTLKHTDLSKVSIEICELEKSLQNNPWSVASYNPHKVEVEGIEYVALDAKRVNRLASSSRRGNYRYLMNEGRWHGLAEHSNANGYRIIAYADA